jgi:hypothetical protein
VQVASKYRSFLTFIRCEFTVLLNPIVNVERARALAQKNMLTLEPIKRASTTTTNSSSNQTSAQRYCIVGTLARAKSFVAELYRLYGQGPERDGDADSGAEESAKQGSAGANGSAADAEPPATTTSPSKPVVRVASLPSASSSNGAAEAAVAAANAALLASVPLVEVAVTLLSRNEGEQLIGALCDEVYKALRRLGVCVIGAI